MLGPSFPDLSRRDPLFLGPARVPMIAIAIATSPVLENSSRAGATIPAVMVAMLLGSLMPAVAVLRPTANDAGTEATS